MIFTDIQNGITVMCFYLFFFYASITHKHQKKQNKTKQIAFCVFTQKVTTVIGIYKDKNKAREISVEEASNWAHNVIKCPYLELYVPSVIDGENTNNNNENNDNNNNDNHLGVSIELNEQKIEEHNDNNDNNDDNDDNDDYQKNEEKKKILQQWNTPYNKTLNDWLFMHAVLLLSKLKKKKYTQQIYCLK